MRNAEPNQEALHTYVLSNSISQKNQLTRSTQSSVTRTHRVRQKPY